MSVQVDAASVTELAGDLVTAWLHSWTTCTKMAVTPCSASTKQRLAWPPRGGATPNRLSRAPTQEPGIPRETATCLARAHNPQDMFDAGTP